jgi:integrase/recombinase XerD
VERYAAGRVQGSLAPFAAGFVVELVGRGYRPRSLSGQLELMAHLSGWLAEQGLGPAGLTEEVAERFLAVRRERVVSLRSWRALGPVVVYLRGLGVVPEPVVSVDTPVARLVADYRDYLLRERGLTAGSVAHWERVARLFLAERSEPLEDALRELTTGEVTGFVVARCASGRCSGSTAKILTGGLRSLLRYLHVAGFTAFPLAQAVPRAAGWRLSALPRALETEQVARLLESCDRASAVGRRDLAILALLSRLGLRCCEVAGLCLDDIDWRAGEVTIRGKGSATERLPLPRDVGEALVDYLRDGRPVSAGFREVFVTAKAPRRRLSPTAVTHVVGCACKRVGMAPVGAHRLRHTLACELLRVGTPLAQIAPILRHASVATTAIYAKVDRDALKSLARPWPLAGGAP